MVGEHNTVRRAFYLDWVRVFAVLLLVPFHTGMIYVFFGWHIKSDILSLPISLFNEFIAIWQMAILFFVAGAASWYALESKKGSVYVYERIKRLLVPLLFGMLIIVPPQIYMERIHRQQFQGSFLEFYPNFHGIYPDGNLSWHHLWFLAYLFVFSMLLLPLFTYLKKTKGNLLIQKLEQLLKVPGGIFLPAFPIFLTEFLLRTGWPDGNQNLINDWANFLLYGMLFICGYLFCSIDQFWEEAAQKRHTALIAGITLILLFLALDLSGNTPAWEYNLSNMALLGLRGINKWCWVLVILGYAKKHFNFNNRFLQYANEAVLPFYILHQTAIVIIGYYILKLSIGILPQYLIIIAATYLTVIIIYEFIVKRINLIRFFFGMKTIKKESNR